MLLNLYAYSSETMREFISILKGIPDRLWIPHQAAMEYQQRRLDVIQQQVAAYDEIKQALKKAQNKLEQDIRAAVRQGKHPFIDIGELRNKIKSFFPAVERELEKLKDAHPDFFYEDPIRKTLTTILENKVGPPFSQEQLRQVYEQGQKRYGQKVPPGYEDAKKNPTERYNDLLLWLQIIDKAKEAKKAILLITDDTKEDWWWKFKGKTIGPRPELIQEMEAECGTSFYMYQSDQFMKYARVHLSQEVPQKAIDEVRALIQGKALDQLVDEVKTLIEMKKKQPLMKIIDAIRPSDIADIIEQLNHNERLYILDLLELEDGSEVLFEIEAPAEQRILSELDNQAISEIMQELESDDAAEPD